MGYRIIVFFLFVPFFCYTQESIDSSDIVLSDNLSSIEIFSNPIREDRSISLSRKQFLFLAGSLEDPTRLLIKFPGISTANDQANSIIYHSMPAQYHKWSLFGARILNPNHLGNAGTISDFPSRSAGGVNMLSGQVIGALEFYGSPSDKSLDALSASSNMKIRNPYQNAVTTNLSLIGLEVGIDRVSNDGQGSFLLNYRYSTVGLLTSLGLDFGGEVINYQDITGKYSRHLKNGDALSIYFSGGFDSNNKEPISPDTQPKEYKDQQQIDYNSFNVIGGFLYNRDKDEYSFHNTLNVSINRTDRTSLIPNNSIHSVTESDFSSDEMLLASRHDISILSGKWKYGFTFEPYLHTTILEYKYPDRSQEVLKERSLDRNALHLLPSIHSEYQISDHLNVAGRLGVQSVISSQNMLNTIGQIEIHYSKSKFMSSIKYSKASQAFQPEILIYSISPDFSKSSNYEINASYNGVGITGFYHHIYNLPISTMGYGFSAIENLDNLPIGVTSDDVAIKPKGLIDAYGLSFFAVQNIRGFHISSNLTLMDSKHVGIAETTKAPLDYGHVFNVSLSKNWKIGQKKQFGFSTSFHHRGGARQNQVDLTKSFDWGYTNFSFENQYAIRLADYYRLDFRIIYKPSKRSTISLDIQNVMNRENDAYYYYEAYRSESTLKKQLGMIPILGWKVDW